MVFKRQAPNVMCIGRSCCFSVVSHAMKYLYTAFTQNCVVRAWLLATNNSRCKHFIVTFHALWNGSVAQQSLSIASSSLAYAHLLPKSSAQASSPSDRKPGDGYGRAPGHPTGAGLPSKTCLAPPSAETKGLCLRQRPYCQS